MYLQSSGLAHSREIYSTTNVLTASCIRTKLARDQRMESKFLRGEHCSDASYYVVSYKVYHAFVLFNPQIKSLSIN